MPTIAVLWTGSAEYGGIRIGSVCRQFMQSDITYGWYLCVANLYSASYNRQATMG